MAQYLSGKRGKITIAGLDMHVTNWSGTLETEAVDVSNTGTSGWKEFISGLSGGNVSFDFVHDTSNVIGNKLTNLHRGAQGAFAFILGDSSGLSDTLSGTVQIESVTFDSTVEGRVEGSASGVFSGAITGPS